jgi:hypothetical protein
MLPAGNHYIYFIAGGGSANPAVLVDSVTINAGSAPNNDDFTNRQQILGLSNFVTGDNLLATTEPGEPVFGLHSPENSVWYTWTAPANGTVNLSLLSDFTNANYALAVFLGTSLTNLADVAYEEAFGSGVQVALTFPGVAGTTYQIEVADTVAGGGGPFALSLQSTPPLPPPPNDNIVNASLLVQSGSASGYNLGATAESHDPFDY